MCIFRLIVAVCLVLSVPACKSLESSSGLSAFGRYSPNMTLDNQPIELLYLKHVMRGNDDTVGATPESQHETALLEFAIYDKQGELWLDYTFFSPAFPAVRAQVEVGIRSNFAIRQVVNNPLLSLISTQQQAQKQKVENQQADASNNRRWGLRQAAAAFTPYFYPRHLGSAVLTTTTRVFNASRAGLRFNTAERNGFVHLNQLGLMDTFKETTRGTPFLNYVHSAYDLIRNAAKHSKLASISAPQRSVAKDGSQSFKYNLVGNVGMRTLEYYYKSYTARIKLAGVGYQNQATLGGEFIAQAGSVFNASSLWLKMFATQASYQPVDQNLLRQIQEFSVKPTGELLGQMKSDQLTRQLVSWRFDRRSGFRVNPYMLSMADQGRAHPSQDSLRQNNTAGVFSTNPNEAPQMASNFYSPIDATAIKVLNRVIGVYTDRIEGKDVERYNSQIIQ